eukprot:COSAG06_NODE_13550_length_1245_cov_2.993019_2_plen_115_part_00
MSMLRALALAVLCAAVSAAEDPQSQCNSEYMACVMDDDCVDLLDYGYEMNVLMQNDAAAAFIRCQQQGEPCGTELLDCAADGFCWPVLVQWDDEPSQQELDASQLCVTYVDNLP